MKNTLLFILSFNFQTGINLYAQLLQFSPAAEASAFRMLAEGGITAYSNPALCASIKENQISALSSVSYGLNGIRQNLICASGSFTDKSVTGSIGSIAFDSYRLYRVKAGTGVSFGKKLSAGMQFRSDVLNIRGYGSRKNYGIDLHLYAFIRKELEVNVCLVNVVSSGLPMDPNACRGMQTTLVYRPERHIAAAIDGGFILSGRSYLSAGLFYRHDSVFYCSISYRLRDGLFSLQSGIRKNRTIWIASAVCSVYAGMSYTAGITITYGKH